MWNPNTRLTLGAHRVADRRILRLIQKWLKAGVSEDGQWSESKVGTPHGAVVSPLLANVYLHYVFDLWIEAWRQKVAAGDVIVVRYADDLVVGFENRREAERFLEAFRERLAKFGLELHPEKTRLIEFGRFAASDREKRGEGKPETFTFLGGLLLATPYKQVDVTDAVSVEEATSWWEELTSRGGEGMVVKPLDFIARGRRGLTQPAVKCRGPEYLRIIYGPEYLLAGNLGASAQSFGFH